MREHFITLFRYNVWANKRIVNCVSQNLITDEKLIKVLSHILAAQILWYQRMTLYEGKPINPWQEYTLQELEQEINDSSNDWLRLVETSDDVLTGEINYTNSAGENFRSLKTDVLTHLINHSTHHRGQAAMIIRSLGYVPPPTDFIVFRRSFDN